MDGKIKWKKNWKESKRSKDMYKTILVDEKIESIRKLTTIIQMHNKELSQYDDEEKDSDFLTIWKDLQKEAASEYLFNLETLKEAL